ncbi:MAG TPA: hypothetical protein VFD39_01675 [Trueperaceae bacterium]|nr:hypothetical protein [Trueperaceae bacterium]
MTETITDKGAERASSRQAEVPAARLTRAFHDRYKELLEGVPAGEPTWVTTGGPGGGVYGTLAKLSASQASAEVDGTTVAAHAEHLRWALQLVNDHFAGVEPTGDWSESWLVKEVDAATWNALRSELKEAGTKLLANILELQQWGDGMGITGALASYGHTAYHLGALRQLQKRVEGSEDVR